MYNIISNVICYFILFNLRPIIKPIAAGTFSTAIYRRDMNFTGLVKIDGYKSEMHSVTTSDGYILSIFRVLPNVACSEFVGEPIMFMHGLYLSADDCVVPGPKAAHCYLYADQCRDVWVPNMRGNLYSRAHVTLNPDKDSEFWDFTWENMALQDLPAIIDYVLAKTSSKKIAYVSHSQGGTALLYLCAKRPEYNEKISVAFGLSMMAWLDHAQFIVFKVQKYLSPLLTIATQSGLNSEFLPRGAFYQPLAKKLCGTSKLSYLPCSQFYFTVLGYDEYQLSADVLAVLTGHIPSGTSLRNFDRWRQIKKNGFTEMDFGPQRNKAVYGQVTPSEIDLHNVTMKWIFIDSKNDYVSNERDLAKLAQKLVDSTTCIVSDKKLGHLDYIFGARVSTLIVPMITEYLDTGHFKCL